MKTIWLLATTGCLMLRPGALAAQARWSVDEKPLVELGGTSSGEASALGLPIAATRLADGAIVIADQRAYSIRFFAADGKFVKASGARGKGPGDFGQIMWLGQCAPDSVFVWDLTLRRMTVLDANAAVARTYPVPAAASDGAAPFVVACSRGGVFAFQPSLRNPSTPPTPELPIVRGHAPVFVGDAKGAYLTRLTEAPEGELFVTGLSGGPRGGGPRPLGKVTSLAVSGDRVFVGTADSGYVDVYSVAGQRLTPLSLGIAVRPATKQSYDVAIEDLTKMAPPPMRERLTSMLTAVPMPEHLPAYSALVTDSEGLLWALLSTPGDSQTHLRAYDGAGKPLGELRMRAGLKVFEIGRDYILAGYDTEDGEPHVALYRMHR